VFDNLEAGNLATPQLSLAKTAKLNLASKLWPSRYGGRPTSEQAGNLALALPGRRQRCKDTTVRPGNLTKILQLLGQASGRCCN